MLHFKRFTHDFSEGWIQFFSMWGEWESLLKIKPSLFHHILKKVADGFSFFMYFFMSKSIGFRRKECRSIKMRNSSFNRNNLVMFLHRNCHYIVKEYKISTVQEAFEAEGFAVSIDEIMMIFSSLVFRMQIFIAVGLNLMVYRSSYIYRNSKAMLHRHIEPENVFVNQVL